MFLLYFYIMLQPQEVCLNRIFWGLGRHVTNRQVGVKMSVYEEPKAFFQTLDYRLDKNLIRVCVSSNSSKFSTLIRDTILKSSECSLNVEKDLRLQFSFSGGSGSGKAVLDHFAVVVVMTPTVVGNTRHYIVKCHLQHLACIKCEEF